MNITGIALAISFLPFFEARNTTANYLVEPPADGAAEVSAERPPLTVHEKCPACDGTGTILLVEEDFGQKGAGGRIGGPRKTKKKCPLCDGRKRLETFMNPTELASQVVHDFERYQSAHLSKGEVPVGNAYVPGDKFEGLSKERRKLVAQSFGKPCKTCNWTGIEACKKCKGRGVVDCPNDDCKGGWAVTKTTTSYQKSRSGGSINGGFRNSYGSSGSRRVSKKETTVNVQVCPDCGGANIVLCPDCGGRRATPCRKCSGTGTDRKGSGLD